MTHENVLGWIILMMVLGGTLGYLLQEIPNLIKKSKKKSKPHIKVGMYYK